MAGQTTHNAVEPRGEYVFGVITARPMQSRRGAERRVVQPGQLLVWDTSHGHTGSSADGQPWDARLMVVDFAGLRTLVDDEETAALVNVAFPEPVPDVPTAHAGEREPKPIGPPARATTGAASPSGDVARLSHAAGPAARRPSRTRRGSPAATS